VANGVALLASWGDPGQWTPRSRPDQEKHLLSGKQTVLLYSTEQPLQSDICLRLLWGKWPMVMRSFHRWFEVGLEHVDRFPERRQEQA
jgi:hypothetical protein